MAVAAAPSPIDFLTQFRWWTSDPVTRIRHKNARNKVLFETDSWSIKSAVEKAASEGVRLGGAWLPQTKLARSNLDNLYISSADMTGARLRRAKFRKVIASKTIFEDARMQGIQAAESEMTDAKMARARLHYADLYKTDLSRADLTEARMPDVSAIEARLNGATMKGVVAPRAHFSKASMQNVDMTDGKFRGAKFIDADLTGAIAKNADLRGVSFRGATTTEMDLSGANLSGSTWPVSTDFKSMKMDANTKLDGIILVDRHGKPVIGATLTNDGSVVTQPGANAPQAGAQGGNPGGGNA